VISELTRAVGAEHVMTDPAQMASYACDGLTGYRVTPQAVVLPATTDEVAACVRICHEAAVPAPACPVARCPSPRASSSACSGCAPCSTSIWPTSA
jgi:FAD/FMN-containing dehydrogenase